ncbi:hypothetical protein V7127_24105 [Bacillus sp. JJ1773]
MKGLSFYLSLFFLFIGVYLQVSNGVSIDSLFYSFANISNIITFIGIIPILAIPIKILFDSKKGLSDMTSDIKSNQGLYNKGQTLSFSMGSIMNLGAIPMSWTILEGKELNDDANRSLATSITRGFSLAMLWSPIGAGVAIIVDTTGVFVIKLLPISLGIAIFGLLLDRFINSFSKNPFRLVTEISLQKTPKSRVMYLVFPLLLFMTSTILLDLILPYGMLYIIAITTLPFTYIWSFFLKRTKKYQILLKGHIETGIPGMYGQFGILLSAGFFVNSLENKKFINSLFYYFSMLKEYVGVSTLLIIGMTSVIILAMIGVHQFVAFSLISVMINPLELGISPVIYSLGMLTALSTGIMISPFNGSTALMSSLIKDSPFVIVKWNIIFASIFFSLIAGFLILYLSI